MSFRNITPFSDGTPTFLMPSVSMMYPRPVIQVHQCLFNPVQCVSSFQSMPTGVFELASLPQTFFDFAYFFLILEEEAGGFAVARDLSGEGQVADMLKRRFESVEVVSAELESPEVILGVPWALSLIMVRDRI